MDPPTQSGILGISKSDIVNELEDEILALFREELVDLLEEIEPVYFRWSENEEPADAATLEALLRPLHTMKGSARMAEVER